MICCFAPETRLYILLHSENLKIKRLQKIDKTTRETLLLEKLPPQHGAMSYMNHPQLFEA
jgi:hypothetical protein